MSRHRAVRNLDLDAELAEDFGDDADYLGMPARTHPDDLNPEDQQAMEDALATMQDDLGSQQDQFTERQMREALYETYFDVPSAIALLVQEKEKAEAIAKKRAGTCIPDEGAKAPKVDGVATRSGGGDRGHARASEQAQDAQAPGEAAGASAARADEQHTRPASMSARPTPSDAGAPAAGGSAATAGPPAPASPAPGAPATDAAGVAAAPPKKLSKLQQKMQAAKAKQAHQTSAGIPPAAPAAPAAPAPAAPAMAEVPGTPPRPATAPSAHSSGTSTPLRTPAASRTASPHPPAAPPAPTTAPSGEPLAALFPPRAATSQSAAASPFVQLLERPVATHPHTIGAKPVSDDEMQRLRAAFASLSPDDVVLQARRGTRLAQ